MKRIGILCLWLLSSPVWATSTLYVWTNSATPASPYTNWDTAAHTIQEAVDATTPGDTVVVTDGVYQVGTRVTPGYAYYTCLNRVVITNAIAVCSVNGPASTVIKGGGLNDSPSARCVCISAGTLAGFTLTNGYAHSDGGWNWDQAGGGVNAYGGNGVISNCVINGTPRGAWVVVHAGAPWTTARSAGTRPDTAMAAAHTTAR